MARKTTCELCGTSDENALMMNYLDDPVPVCGSCLDYIRHKMEWHSSVAEMSQILVPESKTIDRLRRRCNAVEKALIEVLSQTQERAKA